MFLVVAYDVVSDKRRARLVSYLKDYGERVNFSVFECRLKSSSFKPLKEHIEKLIDPKEDSVLFYVVCLRCLEKRAALGVKKLTTSDAIVIP